MRIRIEWFIILVLIIAAMALIGTCGNNKKHVKDLRALAGYKDTAMYYQDKYGEQVAYNEALELDNSSLKDVRAQNADLRKRLEGFKNVDNVTVIRTNTRIDTVFMNFTDTIPCVFTRNFSIDSPFYNIGGVVNQKRITFESIEIPNKQSIVVGQKKLGFLKGKEYRVEVVNENPMVRTEGVQSYTFKDRKKWYQTQAFSAAIGFAGGYLLNDALNK